MKKSPPTTTDSPRLEDLRPLKDLAQVIPGGCSVPTLYRYATGGFGGRILRTVRLGAKGLYSTAAWVVEFAQAVRADWTPKRGHPPCPAIGKSPRSRRRAKASGA